MKFGIREVADMTFTKLSGVGPAQFIINSAKTSTLEGSSTTVYAQGGQGNSRLMAWEGEKTLTFTVEDALITMESFYALTGAEVTDTENGIKFTTKTTSFAGYYSIHAHTLFRDENGNDHAAYIDIPRAKLQSNISLAMAPSGDPSTFTFTFDAFPGNTEQTKDVLFTLEICDENDVTVDLPSETLTEVVLNIQGASYTLTHSKEDRDANRAFAPQAVVGNGSITLKNATTGSSNSKTITVKYDENNDTGITDLVNYYANGSNETINITSSVLTLYVI